MLSQRRVGPLPLAGETSVAPAKGGKADSCLRPFANSLRTSRQASPDAGGILLRMTNRGSILATIPADQLTARHDVPFDRVLNLLLRGSRGQIQF